ncbi:DUF4148 domain-containing protein [Derxia gummosa]|uniref:DUF4148 domain-containing protein n=1 Tax=Derxia gummosa DSM 723 TaxID=1121388 RepID=A0A8B6X9E8_9BURK|nr:DUF4148 domain-containing protein [Derxia gummosa]
MNKTSLLLATLALTLSGAAAHAAGIPATDLEQRLAEPYRGALFEAPAEGRALTREQVRAELAEALRLGDAPVGEDGLTPRERNPAAFPARAVVARSRAEVKAELAEALRLGLAPIGEDGLAPRDRAPAMYPAS